MKKVMYILILMLAPATFCAAQGYYMIHEIEVVGPHDAIIVRAGTGGSLSCGRGSGYNNGYEPGNAEWFLKSNSEVYDMAKSIVLTALVAELPVLIFEACDEEGSRYITDITVTKRDDVVLNSER